MTFNIFHEEKEIHAIFSDVYQPLKKKKEGPEKLKRVIVIAGPTASGKTDLSIALAEAIGGEVISADSMQVYQGMDIGTAKVSQEIRQKIPHHLIDIRQIHESFNVMAFYHESKKACTEILERGNVPIFVGGTGFYLHAFLHGPPGGPPSDLELRKKLEGQMEQLGCEVLYERLQMLDPDYANTITEFDKHKIIRALEIIQISKKKVSEFPKENKLNGSQYDCRCWFVYYPKEILYNRVDARCKQMIEDGFLDEVKALEKKGLRKNVSASQAIGYKQCLDFLETNQESRDFEQFMHDFKRASRKYTKRQFTWFRKEPHFRWIDLSEIHIEYVKEMILQDFEIGY